MKIYVKSSCSYSDALANFKSMYPKVSVMNDGQNEDESGWVVETNDGGFHTISDTQISQYYSSYDQAYSHSLAERKPKSNKGGLFEHSFYYADKRKSNEEIIEFLKSTNKPIKYTYGYKWKHPSTYEVPKTLDQAIAIVNENGLLDVEEKPDYIDMNEFSENDMW